MKELSLAPLSRTASVPHILHLSGIYRHGTSSCDSLLRRTRTEAEHWGGGHVGVADRSLEAWLVVAAFVFTHNTLFSVSDLVRWPPGTSRSMNLLRKERALDFYLHIEGTNGLVNKRPKSVRSYMQYLAITCWVNTHARTGNHIWSKWEEEEGGYIGQLLACTDELTQDYSVVFLRFVPRPLW